MFDLGPNKKSYIAKKVLIDLVMKCQLVLLIIVMDFDETTFFEIAKD